MATRVTDRPILFECVGPGADGYTGFAPHGDRLGRRPSPAGLNEFKTKSSKEIVEAAPTREAILRPVAYETVQTAHRVFRSLRGESKD